MAEYQDLESNVCYICQSTEGVFVLACATCNSYVHEDCINEQLENDIITCGICRNELKFTENKFDYNKCKKDLIKIFKILYFLSCMLISIAIIVCSLLVPKTYKNERPLMRIGIVLMNVIILSSALSLCSRTLFSYDYIKLATVVVLTSITYFMITFTIGYLIAYVLNDNINFLTTKTLLYGSIFNLSSVGLIIGLNCIARCVDKIKEKYYTKKVIVV